MHPNENPENVLRAAKCAPEPKVLLIDDGQLVDNSLIQNLIELASDSTVVLDSITDQSVGGTNHIRISNTAATEAIAANFLDRRDEVLAVVSELDKDVGDRYGDIPIEILNQ